jgi:hypothetical protein
MSDRIAIRIREFYGMAAFGTGEQVFERGLVDWGGTRHFYAPRE